MKKTILTSLLVTLGLIAFSRPNANTLYIVCKYTGTECLEENLVGDCTMEWVSGIKTPCELNTYWTEDANGNMVRLKACCQLGAPLSGGKGGIDLDIGTLAPTFNHELAIKCNNGSIVNVFDYGASLPAWSFYIFNFYISGTNVMISCTERVQILPDSFIDGSTINFTVPLTLVYSACASGQNMTPKSKNQKIYTVPKADFKLLNKSSNEEFLKLDLVNPEILKLGNRSLKIYSLNGTLIKECTINSDDFSLDIKYNDLPKGIVLLMLSNGFENFTYKYYNN